MSYGFAAVDPAIMGIALFGAAAYVLINLLVDLAQAWVDPVRGAELARAQIAQGADVVWAAAGTTGLGVMQATADAGQYRPRLVSQ